MYNIQKRKIRGIFNNGFNHNNFKTSFNSNKYKLISEVIKTCNKCRHLDYLKQDHKYNYVNIILHGNQNKTKEI